MLSEKSKNKNKERNPLACLFGFFFSKIRFVSMKWSTKQVMTTIYDHNLYFAATDERWDHTTPTWNMQCFRSSGLQDWHACFCRCISHITGSQKKPRSSDRKANTGERKCYALDHGTSTCSGNTEAFSNLSKQTTKLMSGTDIEENPRKLDW